MADTKKKQLVLVVEGTAALGPHWRNILSDYLRKLIRSFCGNEATEAASTNVEFALVVFNAHGSYSSCLVQRSGWMRSVDYFLESLSAMNLSGGGVCNVAIAEGLAEVLMMCPPIESQTHQNEGIQRHCILVAASDPHPLPTLVYRPPNKTETHPQGCLLDAEAVAKFFPQSCVSLSVICPRQLLKLKAIYNAGKRNPSAADPTIGIVKNPHYLLLISESFMEACTDIHPSGTTNSPSNQTPNKLVPEPAPTSVSPVIESGLNQQSVYVRNISPVTIKAEPRSPQALQHVPRAVSQGVSNLQTSLPLSTSPEVISSNNSMQKDVKPVVGGTQQPVRPAGPMNRSILTNPSQARPTNPAALMPNMISKGTVPSIPVAQTVTSSVQSTITPVAPVSAPLGGSMMATHGMSQQQVQGMQSVGVNNNMATNAQQLGRSSYVKVWEGELCGMRQGQPVLITKLEAYQTSTAPKRLANDWPSTFKVDRLLSQEQINQKECAGKADIIVFRAMNQHSFLASLQEKKICTVIKLPSQTLLLSVTDKPCRLMGMLFSGSRDKVAFKPQISEQQPRPSQQQQQKQMAGTEMNQVSSPGQKP